MNSLLFSSPKQIPSHTRPIELTTDDDDDEYVDLRRQLTDSAPN